MNSKRPSVYVALCAAVIVVGFTYRGDLAVGDEAQKRRVADAPLAARSVRSPKASLATPLATVHGSVFDAFGFLVVGADVTPAGGAAVRTDADGRFALSLQPGQAADVLFASAGHRAAWRRASAGALDPLVVALEPQAPWDRPAGRPEAPPAEPVRGEGRVVDADGKPVANALVTAVETGACARTDDLGRYALALPAGPVTRIAHCPDGGPQQTGLCARSEPFAPARPKGTVPLPDLVAGAGVAVRGTVRDARGNPAAGVPLRLSGNGLVRTIESGQNGAFRVAGLLPGRYELVAHAWRGALGIVRELQLDQPVADCEVQLQQAPSVRLQVVREDGAPVSRAWVASSFAGLRRDLAQVDADGFAELQAAATAPEFEVRAGDEWTAFAVRRFDAENGRLVVAAP